MKLGAQIGICVLLAQLATVTGMAQTPAMESDSNSEMASVESYSLGDLALTDYTSGTDPLQQLKHFFADSKLPLTLSQEHQLKADIAATEHALQAAKDETAVRQTNQQFNHTLFATLTSAQQTALTHYRSEQIMLRGGAPALTLIMQTAQTPLSAEQHQQIVALYSEFNQRAAELSRTSGTNAGRAQLAKLEGESLLRVVKLLTPAQRRALAASRLGSLNSTATAQQ